MSLALKAAWALFAIVWLIAAFTAKRTLRRQSLQSRIGLLVIAVAEYYVLFWVAKYFGFVYRRFLPDQQKYLWIGLLMTVSGVAFAIWARAILGRNWSGTVTVKQDHELIRRGPYAIVRHPIYTGLIFAAVGTAIFDGEIRSMIVVVAILAALIPKMKLEERFMTEQFGSEYASYQQKTRALLPFVW